MLYISHAVMETGKILKPVVQLLSSVDAVYFVFVGFFFLFHVRNTSICPEQWIGGWGIM